jgi:teichuronic acid biosynthesis glycosyltransferase TuaG
MDKVSVVVPTYNRFDFLLNTIKSIKEQTYKNIEIIVVNDCSSEKEYYEYDWKGNDIVIIHLPQNTNNIFGYACGAFVRNKGIEISNGKYVAFCDDDDIWFPQKLDLQIKAMKESGCKMSSTDGLIGNCEYNPRKIYKKFNAEHYFYFLINVYRSRGIELPNGELPDIWNLDFLNINNCVITSSVLIEKEILNKINNMRCLKNGEEDYDCWLRALEHTNNVYVKDVCFYYNFRHGYIENY